jgi:DNA primase large subunit
MLHAILLGMFKYTKECFFLQIGETSLLAQEINALAQKYGELLAHQSNPFQWNQTLIPRMKPPCLRHIGAKLG